MLAVVVVSGNAGLAALLQDLPKIPPSANPQENDQALTHFKVTKGLCKQAALPEGWEEGVGFLAALIMHSSG
jgi:hypothetical protein